VEEGAMFKKGSIFITFFLLFQVLLHGGGWNNSLMGCRAISMGGAFAGVADDPSAIFYNPAGLVFQKGNFNFSVDGFYIWPTHEYTLSTGSKIYSRYNNPLPQVFFTYKTSDRLTLGFGVYVPYAGGGIDWKKQDLGFPMRSTLGVVSFTPTIAYQVSEKISLGFNLNFYRGVLNVKTEMNPFGPMTEEETGSAFSAGIGIMYKPSEKLNLGFSLRGPAKIKLAGTTSITFEMFKLNLDSETTFHMPWDMEAGFSYKIMNRLLFSASAQYTLWSVLDKVQKKIKDIPMTGNLEVNEILDFKNILIFRAGFEYHILPQSVFLRAGIGIDPSASPESTLSATNIDVNKVSLLGGIGYRAGKMQIDAVYAYAFGKEREKKFEEPGGSMIEKYNLNVSILGLGVTFSF
jgi:long-chain fatty acid transport protein